MRLVLFMVCLFGALSPLKADDWSLEIIPTYSSTDKQSIDTRGEAFTVLLTNISDHDLNVWPEEFSWGYDNLSFFVTRANGATFRIVKVPIVFTMNVAFPCLVKSHRHFSWSVTFSPDEWTGFPADWKGTEDITIQALFEIDPTNESKKDERMDRES